MRTRRLRLGVPRASFYDDLDSEVATAVTAALEALTALTTGARDVVLPAAISGARLWGPEAYVVHRRSLMERRER